MRGLSSSPVIARSVIAFVDQAILSATNFTVSLLLIKNVPAEEYGYYSIAFALSLFLVSVQDAVVSTPLAVLLAAKNDDQKPIYVSALYWGQILFLVPALGVGLILAGGLFLAGVSLTKALTMAATCIAAAGILPREFLRAYYFAEESPLTVLKLDSYFVFLYLGSIILTYLYAPVSVPLIFVLMGVSALLSVALVTGFQQKACTWTNISESFKENWPFGRWALVGVTVTHVQTYSNLYLLGSLLNSIAVGSISASRLPLMPISLIQAGWNKVALPRGSRLREDQQLPRFFREQVTVSIIIAIGITVYVCVLLTFADVLKQFVFTDKYENVLDFIIYWGAINAVSYATVNASLALQVIREFRSIAKVNFVTMIVTLCAGYVLIQTHASEGALIASLIGETLFMVILWGIATQRYFLHAKPLPSLLPRTES